MISNIILIIYANIKLYTLNPSQIAEWLLEGRRCHRCPGSSTAVNQMDYSLAALKLFCCQLKDARQISSDPPSMTLHGIRFQRAWCQVYFKTLSIFIHIVSISPRFDLQGVVVSRPNEGHFLLDDGSGVVELSLNGECKTQDWKSGEPTRTPLISVRFLLLFCCF